MREGLKTCVLIAGMPASGKTTFALHLAKQLSLPLVSKDRIKELMYNNLGFQNREEKNRLGSASMDILYYFAEALMRTGQPFILENNFEARSKPQLLALLQAYPYKTVTVRFGGDVGVIYKRYLQRNKNPARHRGHVVNACYPEDPSSPILLRELSFEEFAAGVEQRGIKDFTLGQEELYVDTTYFETVRYEEIVDKVRRLMGPPPVW